MKSISPTIRSRIVLLLRTGRSIRAVAAQTGIGRSTVARIAKTECKDRVVCLPGRPRLLSARDERQIVKRVTAGEASTAVQAQQQLGTVTKGDVSVQTVRRVLRCNGLRAHIKPKKPLLMPHHRQQRLAFARKYQHWTVDD